MRELKVEEQQREFGGGKEGTVEYGGNADKLWTLEKTSHVRKNLR
jgi:hypothetical protein